MKSKVKRTPPPKPTIGDACRAVFSVVARHLNSVVDALNAFSPVLTALATGLLVWVAIWQWIELHSTDGTLRETLRAQIKSSQLQLRAYVGTEAKRFELRCASCDATAPRAEKTANGFYKDDYIIITFRNSGQTPANNLSVTGSWKEMPFGKPLPLDFDYPNTIDDGVDCRGVVNPGDLMPAGQLLTPERIAMVKRARNHEATIYFYGEISYRDVFGKNRSTPYCRVYDPDVADAFSFGFCPQHNTPAEGD